MDDNSKGDLVVPGFGGMPIDYKIEPKYRFAHGTNDYRQTPAITARELAMTDTMGWVTDKPNWHNQIFDDEIASQWQQEARTRNKLIGNKAWKWCLAELRDKAVEYRDKRFVRVVDAGSCACKSDELVPDTVGNNLKSILAAFYVEDEYKDGILDVVDPDLFPLTYGKTHVLQQGATLKLSNDLEKDLLVWTAKQFQKAKRQRGWKWDIGTVKKQIDRLGISSEYDSCWDAQDDRKSYFWSEKFQRLPCDVEFIGDCGTEVKINSYINNLHPSHTSVYRDIEKLISASILLWSECLIKGSDNSDHRGTPEKNKYDREGDQTQRGRIPLRIIAFGAVWESERTLEELLNDEVFKTWKKALAWARQTSQADIDKRVKIGGRTMTARAIIYKWGWIDTLPSMIGANKDEDEASELSPNPDHIADKFCMTMCYDDLKWHHPQPRVSFSYDDWKSGKNVDRAVVKMIRQPQGTECLFENPNHERYDVQLQQSFRKQGLQIIVKIGGIHLPVQIQRKYTSPWQLEGMLNEHIVATSIYAYDVENVTAKFSFRQETPMPRYVYRYEHSDGPVICQTDRLQDIRYRGNSHGEEIEALTKVFGFESITNLDACLHQTVMRFQNIGAVSMPQGRLLTFSNVVEHQLQVELKGGSRSGHFRYVALYLVDPNYHICSTGHVPPQQHEWWARVVVELLMSKGLPYEIAQRICKLSHWPMTTRRAKRYKEEMLQERSRMYLARYSKVGSYNF